MSNKSNRNHFIDLLKGICIVFVIVTHFNWSDDEKLTYYFPYWLNMAVPLFMIISGYVYAFSYRKNKILLQLMLSMLFFPTWKLLIVPSIRKS